MTWISNLGLDEATEEGYEAFAKVQCKKLGFSFIWIRYLEWISILHPNMCLFLTIVRSKIHDGGTTRCGITGRKTGYEPGSDQDHITVFLGLLRNWVSLHGHIYVIEDEDLRVPVGLIPISGRWIDKNGQPGRNPELWVWTKQRAQEESESTRQAMNTSWRVATRGKQENRDRSWGNSRLPKR